MLLIFIARTIYAPLGIFPRGWVQRRGQYYMMPRMHIYLRARPANKFAKPIGHVVVYVTCHTNPELRANHAKETATHRTFLIFVFYFIHFAAC